MERKWGDKEEQGCDERSEGGGGGGGGDVEEEVEEECVSCF